MTRKAVLLFLVCLAVALVGAVGLARADSSELAAINAALHEQGRTWVAGETAISRLPAHERSMHARLIKPQATGREQVIAQGALQSYSLAPTLDWRNNGRNFVTPVRNQGNCGSCWAFATTAALESFLLISQPTIFPDPTALDLAEQILVSCGGAGDCNGGYIDRASNYVRDTGLPVEDYDTYTATNGTCPAGWPGAVPADKSQGWGWVTTTSVSVDALKNALTTYGPLITTMDVYADFFSYTSGVYQYTSGSLQGGHAVLIVGFTDDTTTPAWGGGYFIVKNSWGKGWGDQVTPGEAGFFKIAYSETSSKVAFGEWTITNTNTAPACTFSINPASAKVTADAGGGSVAVNASAGTCGWTASSNSQWISVSPTSGTGSKTVNYSYQPNPGQARNFTATIAGKTFTVSQAAANIPIIAVSPTSVSFGPVRVGKTSKKNVTISNKGAAALTNLSIGITTPSDFSQTNTCGSQLASSGSCTVQVTFKPSGRTSKSASLSIYSDDPVNATVSVPLSGKGN